MSKTASTKHTITQYNSFGSNVTANDVVGTFAIWATLTGSYGETIHRIVGGSYWDIEKCLKKALKYHTDGKYRDIEISNLQTKWRVGMNEILVMQKYLTTPVTH